MDKVFVVTRYWDNGGSWEDHIHSEEPQAVFSSKLAAENYCRENNGVKKSENEYSIKKNISNYIRCPIGLHPKSCNAEYGDDNICTECFEDYQFDLWDNSFEQFIIYEVGMSFKLY